MGTNFYDKNFDHKNHIGKRSAAGLYCWDCNITLCKDGEVHNNSSNWDTKCPVCGKVPEKENLSNSTAGRELGFNKNLPKRKAGVASCCSFSWCIQEQNLKKCKNIIDEYGRHYTMEEFKQVLEECPIQYRDMVEQEFS